MDRLALSLIHISFSVWVKEHPAIKLGTYAAAAQHGEVLINATNGNGSLHALQLAGEANLNGKVLIDVSNPLDFSQGNPPLLSVANDDSIGEQIQRAYPQVKVVKTLNTVTALSLIHISMCIRDRVSAALVLALGLEPGREEALPQLVASLRRKEVLLVLDNLEHVLCCASCIKTLLDECAHLRIIATARERLHLRGEQRFKVAPVSYTHLDVYKRQTHC